MRLLILVALVAAIAAQRPTPSQQEIEDIFGTPPSSTSPSPTPTPTTKQSEQLIVTPSPGTQVNEKGEPCVCLPYYYCNANDVAVYANNVSVSGYNELDVRFGDGQTPQCTESQEKCCTIVPELPNAEPTPAPTLPPKPLPDTTKLKACGYRNPRGIGAYFQGTPTQFGEYPWIVALLNGSYAGVGVLIHPEVVMTGAHVVSQYQPGGLKIRAGEWDTQTEKEIMDYQERGVQEIYVHDQFNGKTLKNDVALLRLEHPLDLAEHINVLCMPEQDEVFDNYKRCVANGWGKDKFGVKGQYAVFLKKAEVDMVPHARCNMLLKNTRLGSRFNLHSSFVCAIGKEGEDACQGDGGAPLACPIGDERFKLTGLVAWGIGCGNKDVPGVYADAAKFRNWVDDKMAQWGLDTKYYRIQN